MDISCVALIVCEVVELLCCLLVPWKAIRDRAQQTLSRQVTSLSMRGGGGRGVVGPNREMLAAPNSYFFTVLRCNRRYKPRDTPYSQSTMTQDKMWGKIWLFQSNNNAKLICYLGHALLASAMRRNCFPWHKLATHSFAPHGATWYYAIRVTARLRLW